MSSVRFLCCAVLWGLTAGSVAAGSRLDAVRDRGFLVCGVKPNVAGFAILDDEGRYAGFEVDICRALAAAIFGDAERVSFKQAESVSQFKADDDMDIVSRRLTWTLTREAGNGLLFSPIIFYDGAGFLVRAGDAITEPAQLSGRRICVKQGSETQQAVTIHFQSANRAPLQMPFATMAEASRGFFLGECVALAADVSLLAGERAAQGARRDDFAILSPMISKEPLALLMRQDDPAFFLVVRWTIFALIEAEEARVSSANVHTRGRRTPDQERWLAAQPTGEALGLEANWVVAVIGAVGNYGEIFARHLGADSPLRLERGLNRLWNSGGLMYAPPVR